MTFDLEGLLPSVRDKYIRATKVSVENLWRGSLRLAFVFSNILHDHYRAHGRQATRIDVERTALELNDMEPENLLYSDSPMQNFLAVGMRRISWL